MGNILKSKDVTVKIISVLGLIGTTTILVFNILWSQETSMTLYLTLFYFFNVTSLTFAFFWSKRTWSNLLKCLLFTNLAVFVVIFSLGVFAGILSAL